VWIGSAELFVPLGAAWSVCGEGYVGQGAHLFEGAAWQGPRLDLATGRHSGLVSSGGWLQLAYAPVEGADIRLIAGADAVVRGFGRGIAIDDAPDVRGNRLVALVGSWYVFNELALMLQVHQLATRYRDAAVGTVTLHGVALGGQLVF